MVELHFFGRLRDVAGSDRLAVECREGDDIAALVAQIDNPSLVSELRRKNVRAVRDGVIVGHDHPAVGASEILFFPPVSGG